MSRVAVVGLGLIGGSMAASLRRAGHEVRGFDNLAVRTAVGMERGLIDAEAASLEDCVGASEIVILATPVPVILSLLPSIDTLAPKDALVVDTGSVKAAVVDMMGHLDRAERAIGGHPMAGTESSGPEVASADLLVNRTFALCPSARTSRESKDRAAALVLEMGSLPAFVEAGRHDDVVARTSHLPQLVSTALALCLEPDDRALIGPGIRGMTRLARSDARMWTEIVYLNRDSIAEAMRIFSRHFEELARTVEDEDMPALCEAMLSSNRAVAELDAGLPA
jgi:prephenate dehydrogenase